MRVERKKGRKREGEKGRRGEREKGRKREGGKEGRGEREKLRQREREKGTKTVPVPAKKIVSNNIFDAHGKNEVAKVIQ